MKEHIPIEEVLDSFGDSDPDLAAEISTWSPVVGIVKAMVQLRKRLGLTQADLADRLGRKQSAIARLESAELDPRWTTVHETLSALGHRIQIVPAEGDLYVLTDRQIQDIVDSHVAEVFEELRRQALSAALVNVAELHKTTKAAGRDRAEELLVSY